MAKTSYSIHSLLFTRSIDDSTEYRHRNTGRFSGFPRIEWSSHYLITVTYRIFVLKRGFTAAGTAPNLHRIPFPKFQRQR